VAVTVEISSFVKEDDALLGLLSFRGDEEVETDVVNDDDMKALCCRVSAYRRSADNASDSR
jgi:hypothetical protein